MSRIYRKYPPSESRASRIGRVLRNLLLNVLAFCAMLVVCYFLFSLFDTPEQHKIKEENLALETEYAALEARYDTVSMALDNVIARDKNVFRILFESEPYAFQESSIESRLDNYDRLSSLSESELYREMTARMRRLEGEQHNILALFERINKSIDSLGQKANNIPAIQPVINKELTLLTASYGMRIHPFYKSLTSHQGVDYTVPVGSRVFATADGTIKEVKTRKTTSGRTIVINHGGGYETQYSHLSRIDVKKGQKVRRGDIIGLTGNSGLSLSPHLHYEVRFNGMRVDPIHYFFMELSPEEYQRIIQIAQSGMQSFD